MAMTRKTTTTAQDEAVNESRPRLAKMTALMEDALVVVAREALGANREMSAQDQQGRVWTFTPFNQDDQTSLKVSAVVGVVDLGSNRVPTSQLQCEAGDGILRSVIAIIAGGPV